MRATAWLLVACVALAPRAWSQPLPDLGGAGDLVLSTQMERRIGESMVRELRRDPAYIDDPEVADYLAALGARLVQASPGARHDFEFFAVRDHTINAFAMPGGFIGLHTGLLQAAETESELASVLAHEVAHVTQRHIARMLGQQQQLQMPVMVAIAAAILLGRSRPDLAAGAATAAQAGAAQAQLSYSRDFERDADRVGLQALESAGFDVRAMPAFFEKMQRAMRVSDDGSVPGYLRTHPITTERIADAQNRTADVPYKQHPDSQEFHLVRAKLRAEAGDARDAATHFQHAVRDGRYASEAAARYGYAVALLRARRMRDADAELARARKAGASGPMIETLAARIRQAAGDGAGAVAALEQARGLYPYSKSVLYAYIGGLQDAGRHAAAATQLAEALRLHPRDARLHGLQAKTYEALGKRLLQHQAQAEFHALQGNYPGAIEQLQLARSAGDGDFYQLSVVEARLKDLRQLHAEEQKR